MTESAAISTVWKDPIKNALNFHKKPDPAFYGQMIQADNRTVMFSYDQDKKNVNTNFWQNIEYIVYHIKFQNPVSRRINNMLRSWNEIGQPSPGPQIQLACQSIEQ
jgi:hypothetical protein